MRLQPLFILLLISLSFATRTKQPRTRTQNVKVVITNRPLDKLYTWDFKAEKYKPILNNNGKITKNYKGGIYLQKISSNNPPTYSNVHKPKGAYTKKTTTNIAVIKKRKTKRKTKKNIIATFIT